MSQAPPDQKPNGGDGAIVQTAFAFGFEKVEEIERGPDSLKEIGVSAYQELFQIFKRQGWRWQKAAYMAWRASPRDSRYPDTQAELANILGYTSDRNFRVWLNKPDQGPLMEQLIATAACDVLEANKADVDYVTIEQAKALNSTVSQRELFYKRRSDALEEKLRVVQQESEQDDLSNLSDDELEAELERLERVAT